MSLGGQIDSVILPPQNKTVNTYLRLRNSRAVKINLPIHPNLPQLKIKIHELLGVPPQRQILYLGGKQLHQDRKFTFKQQSILHVKDTQDMVDVITIRLITHQPQKQNLYKYNNPLQCLVNVDQDTIISEFLLGLLKEKAGQFDMKRSRIIESGRFLKPNRSFREQKIQQNTQIHLILRHPISQREENQQDQNQHQKFIKKVMRHSRNNSLDLQNPQQQLKQEKKANLQKQFYQSQNLIRFEHDTPGLVTDSNPHFRHSLQGIMGEQNHCAIHKESESIRESKGTYMMHTKSSQNFMRGKVKRLNLTPLKLGLRQYKKYDGPLSIKACTCKPRRKISQKHDQSPQNRSATRLSRPLSASFSFPEHNI